MHENIVDYFDYASQITIINEDSSTQYFKGDDKFELILSSIKEATAYSHEMPAFGVSLDNETKEAKKVGLWVELEFEQSMSHNGMGFDALLFEVNSTHSGFNLIRRNNGKYEGRCFYLSLENNMQKISDAIASLSV